MFGVNKERQMKQQLKLFNIGDVIIKYSGRPFKSGAKAAVISKIGKRMFPPASHCKNQDLVERDVYFFSSEDEDYFVETGQCERIG